MGRWREEWIGGDHWMGRWREVEGWVDGERSG